MNQQILITGVGGQGVLFLSKLLYTASAMKGLPVFGYEIHGMSQRGGSVFASVKVGDFASPQLFPGEVDTMFVLEGSELFPYIPVLRPGGMVAINGARLDEDRREWLLAAGYRLFVWDADQEAMQRGNPRIANLILLGRFMRAMLASDAPTDAPFPLEPSDIIRSLGKIVKADLLELNIRAFRGES